MEKKKGKLETNSGKQYIKKEKIGWNLPKTTAKVPKTDPKPPVAPRKVLKPDAQSAIASQIRSRIQNHTPD